MCVVTWAVHVKDPRATDPWRNDSLLPMVSEVERCNKSFLRGLNVRVGSICRKCPSRLLPSGYLWLKDCSSTEIIFTKIRQIYLLDPAVHHKPCLLIYLSIKIPPSCSAQLHTMHLFNCTKQICWPFSELRPPNTNFLSECLSFLSFFLSLATPVRSVPGATFGETKCKCQRV